MRRPFPDGATLVHVHEGILPGRDAPVDRLETCLDQVPQFLDLLADGSGRHLQPMTGQQLGSTIEGRVVDQVIVEAAVTRAVAAVQIAGLETVAQLAVDHEFIAVTDDRARGFEQVTPGPRRDQEGGDVADRQRLAALEGLHHGREGFQEHGVGRCALEREETQQRPQVAFHLGHDPVDLPPLECALVEGAVAGEVATELLQSLRGQEGMGLLAHGGERRLPVDARIQEQGQDLRQ